MMKKIYTTLKHIYSAVMFIAFFGGTLPVIPFIFAIIVGGSMGEAIALFLYNQYYPWVFASASIAVLAGLAATYVEKMLPDSSTGPKTKFHKKDKH